MKLVEVITSINIAAKAILDNTKLNPLPIDGSCSSCGSKEFSQYEPCHARFISMEMKEGIWNGTTSGFDDYTDNGIAEILICSDCEELFEAPDQIKVQWS